MTDDTPRITGNGDDDNSKSTNVAKRRRNRKRRNKSKKSQSQREEERQKELEFSKMNNHAKLRTRLMGEGFSAAQIDAAMDEMWNSNLPYDEYDQVYKYLKEGGVVESKSQSTRRTTTTTTFTDDDDDVGETNEEVGESKSSTSTKLAKRSAKTNTPHQPKKDPNSMASRLDLVAGFENLSDAIFAMTEWIVRAAKPNDVSFRFCLGCHPHFLLPSF